ncbi:hypothetical protein [Cellulophaga lytica]|uniref:hypothetical protein n=1 Tax=Cellulophaga lytica TaxID=979 RepID=UPI0009507612|nr:hypothetical protein [Cellulophaga lytica]APU10490.1 hypothetical protein A5M85_09410 [Cellulophaga lytica]SNQ44958.1 conserved hypothetical protein [Cellulophaga lytica]
MKIIKSLFKNKSEKLYFKVVNSFFIYNKLTDYELQSYRENDYNNEQDNDYYENSYFYSHLTSEQIQFQVFFTSIGDFRNADFYENAQSIQQFYLNKYEIPFFFNLSNDIEKKKYESTFHKIGDYLKFEDFISVILPNIKFQIISQIEHNKLNIGTYTVFYNWDFFEEIQISNNSNSFLRFITSLPHNSRKKEYTSRQEANMSAFNSLLENACSTVDTTLKGLYFDLGTSNSSILSKDFFGNNPKVVMSIRNLNELETNLIENEVNNSLEILKKKTMEPFEIIKTTANNV